MKILLVAPFTQPHYLWLKALRQLRCRVKIFKLTRFPADKLINWFHLSAVIKQFQPDHIFFSGGVDAILPLKNTIFFTGVAPKTLSANERRIGILAQLVVANDPSHIKIWKKLGAQKTICLPISAIDPKMFKSNSAPRSIPVSFIGTLFPYRQQQLLAICRLYPKLKIWGRLEPGYRLLPSLKPFYQGTAERKQLVKIYQQSLIGLNLAPTHLPAGGNLRAFEIAASGALLLTNRLNPDWYISGREAVLFSQPAECTRQINYYLNHSAKRLAISQKGYRRTLRDHTYYQRFKQLIKLLA